MEEKELCSRTIIFKNRKYLIRAILMLILGGVSIITNIIVRICSAAAYGDSAFKMWQGPYWGGWGLLIVSLLLAAAFFFLYLRSQGKIVITLTNKRIKTVLADNARYIENSFMLNKITSFSKIKVSNMYRLSFSINNKTYEYDTLDEEFYNLFIAAL